MNTIELNQVNHFILHKQHLSDEPKSNDILKIVKDINGLHATSPATPYISLFARTKQYTREQLDEELYIKRNLGKIRCVRKTVYILPKETIPIAFSATEKMIASISGKHCKYLGVTEKQYEDTSKEIMQILKGRAMTAKEIKKELETNLNVSPIINLMCDLGLLIRGQPKKGWKSNIHTYLLFHEFFPELKLGQIDETEARKSVVEKYLASFGPVTENDVAWWTGFPKGQTREIINSLKGEIANVEISTLKDGYCILSSDRDFLTSMKIPEKPVVNILPSLDPYIMGYKDRERYLDQEHYHMIFDRSGNATSSILVNGRVIGVWDIYEPLVKIFLFHDVEPVVLKEIHSKAKDVGMFISGKEVRIKECESMVPLTRRTAGSVMTPLKNC